MCHVMEAILNHILYTLPYSHSEQSEQSREATATLFSCFVRRYNPSCQLLQKAEGLLGETSSFLNCIILHTQKCLRARDTLLTLTTQHMTVSLHRHQLEMSIRLGFLLTAVCTLLDMCPRPAWLIGRLPGGPGRCWASLYSDNSTIPSGN